MERRSMLLYRRTHDDITGYLLQLVTGMSSVLPQVERRSGEVRLRAVTVYKGPQPKGAKRDNDIPQVNEFRFIECRVWNQKSNYPDHHGYGERSTKQKLCVFHMEIVDSFLMKFALVVTFLGGFPTLMSALV